MHAQHRTSQSMGHSFNNQGINIDEDFTKSNISGYLTHQSNMRNASRNMVHASLVTNKRKQVKQNERLDKLVVTSRVVCHDWKVRCGGTLIGTAGPGARP